VLAHHNRPRHCSLTLLTLTLCNLTLWGVGCNSSEQSTEYRQFSEQIDQDKPQTDQPEESKPATVASSDQQNPPQTETEQVTQTSATKPVEPQPTKPGPDTPQKESPTSQADSEAPHDALPLVAQRPDPSQRALSQEEEEQQLTSSKPREVKILVKNRSFRRTSPQNALQVSYDDIDLLKVMNMEPVTPNAPELMPDWLKDLDGKRIRIRGFMYPPFQQTGNEIFLLARDNQICCFGKNPKIYDLFPVVLKDGVTTDYILNRPFDVVGVFHIKPETIDGELERIYMIDDAIVIDQ